MWNDFAKSMFSLQANLNCYHGTNFCFCSADCLSHFAQQVEWLLSFEASAFSFPSLATGPCRVFSSFTPDFIESGYEAAQSLPHALAGCFALPAAQGYQ